MEKRVQKPQYITRKGIQRKEDEKIKTRKERKVEEIQQ